MKGYSIHVGVGEVTEAHYGSIWKLNGAEKDATKMHEIADKTKMYEENETHLLLSTAKGDMQATSENFFTILDSTIDKIRENHANKESSYFFMTFSGHGSRYRHPKHPLIKSEFLCFYDKMILEHEIKAKLLRLPKSCKCFIIIDSCYAGGISNAGSYSNVLRLVSSRESYKHKLIERIEKDIETVSKNLHLLFRNRDPEMPIYSPKIITEEQTKKIVERHEYYLELIAETPPVPDFGYFQSDICFLAACSREHLTYDGFPNTHSMFTDAIVTSFKDDRFHKNYSALLLDLNLKNGFYEGPQMLGAHGHFFQTTTPIYFKQKSI